MNTKMIRIGLFATVVAACDLQPLTHEQLFGPAADGAAPAAADAPVAEAAVPDAAVIETRPETRPEPDAAEMCSPMGMNGLLSGVVVDACSGQQLDANVGVAGQHLCSFRDKGSFFFRALPTGCRLTLTARKDGYRLHSQTIVVSAEGTAGLRIALDRDGASCSTPAPQGPACRCDVPTCTP